MRFVGLLIALGVLLAGCGGGNGSGDPNRILRIGGVDITESEWRANLRAGALFGEQAQLCRSFDGLSDTEATDLLAALIEREAADVLTRAARTVREVDILIELAELATTQLESMALVDEAAALLDDAKRLRDEAQALIDQNVADTSRLAAIVQEECKRFD